MTATDTPSSPVAPPCAAAPLPAFDELDVLVRDDDRLELRALKAIDAGDPYMGGHFPGFGVYPGVFVLESVAQSAAAALGIAARISRVRSMRFLALLAAGDTLEVRCALTPLPGGDGWLADARCRRADGVQCALVKLDLAAEGALDA
jgi:3-hydroxyacyl-[acyl-carrier-protein] dehydratase